MMPKPRDYRHIKAWGRLMNSYPYFIKHQQEKAAAEDAPVNALYWDLTTEQWVTFEDLPKDNPNRKVILEYLERMR